MFESKKWYKEVTILIVIPLIIGSLLTYVIYIGPVTWLMVGLLFMGLAVWRIVKKKSTVKEVIVMKLLHIALGLGFGLLLPYYLAVFLIVGLLFLIISRIHISAVSKSVKSLAES